MRRTAHRPGTCRARGRTTAIESWGAPRLVADPVAAPLSRHDRRPGPGAAGAPGRDATGDRVRQRRCGLDDGRGGGDDRGDGRGRRRLRAGARNRAARPHRMVDGRLRGTDRRARAPATRAQADRGRLRARRTERTSGGGPAFRGDPRQGGPVRRGHPVHLLRRHRRGPQGRRPGPRPVLPSRVGCRGDGEQGVLHEPGRCHQAVEFRGVLGVAASAGAEGAGPGGQRHRGRDGTGDPVVRDGAPDPRRRGRILQRRGPRVPVPAAGAVRRARPRLPGPGGPPRFSGPRRCCAPPRSARRGAP